MKKHIAIFAGIIAALMISSCDSYLDTLPDNRTELNTDEKINDILVFAYPEKTFTVFTEFMSDNIDYAGVNQDAVAELMQEHAFNWKDNIGDATWDTSEQFWVASYKAIAHANQALDAIAEMGNPSRLDPYRGEALLSRAFNHFYLVNVFGMQYNPNTSSSDLGVPYMEIPETDLNPQYPRGTVAEVYEKIEQDLQEGLPLISDNIYTVPKYHFNRQAANAFAARFYLYYKKYDEAIKYATLALGSNPINVLTDFSILEGVTKEYGPWSEKLVKPENPWNFLLLGPITRTPTYFGNYSTGKRYKHCEMLAKSETVMTDGLWGTYNATTSFYNSTLSYSSTGGGWVSRAGLPYFFEYTDPVARIGYQHTVLPILTADEILLCRAEAYIMKDNFEMAVRDLELWMDTHTKTGVDITMELIHDYYSGLDYYEWNKPTVKKRINVEPAVTEGSEKESLIHCLLHFRRIEAIFTGTRWFDIKRFGIEIVHRELNANQDPITIIGELKHNDPRRAIQIPKVIIDAGMEPNPR